MSRARDSQRQRVYDAERSVHDYGRRNLTIEQCQKYVDELLAKKWVQARWGKRRITVEAGRGGGMAHYSSRITLGIWARQEVVILHEVAHCLNSVDDWDSPAHGPEFAGILVALVRLQFGSHTAWLLTEAMRRRHVKRNNDAIPKPERHRVVTKAAARQKQVERLTRPLTAAEVATAAEIIRRAVRQGQFGPSGRKPRAHALETARLLEVMP